MGRTDTSTPYVTALTVSGTDLYAGGYFTSAGGTIANGIARWDGSTWRSLGWHSDIDKADALAVSGSIVFAGGTFTTAGTSQAKYIAKWDGTSWSAMAVGPQLSSAVAAVAVSGSNVYAGGKFTTANGSVGNSIARWDGTSWSALASGLGGDQASVSALATSGSDLYVGGHFTSAGGVWATNIAKWNGSGWSAFGSGMDASVSALAVSGSDLYAGGSFQAAGGTPANYIAKWNGSSWNALGSGMAGGNPYYATAVYALALSGSTLYAAGDFTTAGGNPAYYIAKWDGSNWSALGSGMNGGSPPYSGVVYALAVSGTNLYAAGNFTIAGEGPANYIAKWDGTTWSALGAGLGGPGLYYPYVSALTASGSDLFAGGYFTTAGGTPANYIAKWDGTSWSALGSGMAGQVAYVYALAASGSDLYAGGQFTIAGGKVSAYVARAYLEQPTLSILRPGDSLTLSWPLFYSGFVLQQNPDLANNNGWSDANYPIVTNGAMKSATAPLTPFNQFFRLKEN